MEGKDGEDDPRASPLDFPSASRIGAVFHQEQHQHPQQQYLWARPLTRNNEVFSARQRVEHTISPPTIPRDTDFFAEGPQQMSTSRTRPTMQQQEAAPPPPPRQHINVAGVGSAAFGSGAGVDSTNMMSRRSPSTSSNFSSIVQGNIQEFSTTTSAFTSSVGPRSSQDDLLYHTGRIPAYAGRTIPAAATTGTHQQWYPSGILPATGDISPFSNSTTSPRIQQEYHQSRRPISILAPIHTGPTALSPPSSYPLQELSFFAPVSSPQDEQDRSPGGTRRGRQTWSQSPSNLRPSSAHTITTMGSIGESESSSADLESTRGRAFVQPTARRTRESSRASSSGRGRSSSVSSPYWQ